ncbi:MAG: alpha/beta fold hydrolase [Acidimicrobiales bacterium]
MTVAIPAPHSRYVFVGPQRLRVTVAGEGSDGIPLVLVNGIGATADLYDTLRSHLDSCVTVAFDAPGVNRSPAPAVPVTMGWYADMVAGMAASLGHDRIDVIGVSWGGALVQELAWRHPRLVRRVILAATTPGLLGYPGRPAAMALLLTPARYYSPTYLRRIAPTLYGGDILDHPGLLAEHAYQRVHHAPSIIGYAYQLGAIMGFTSHRYLRRLSQPTLVLAGDDDPIIPLANGRLLAALIPDANLHVVEGGGHLFLFTRAKEMAGLIEEFLDH